jgi:hypothetical protein
VIGPPTTDGDVDRLDAFRFLSRLFSSEGDPRYLDYLDYDGSGAIDLIDALAFLRRLGSGLHP